jgi:hypothetical protein
VASSCKHGDEPSGSSATELEGTKLHSFSAEWFCVMQDVDKLRGRMCGIFVLQKLILSLFVHSMFKMKSDQLWDPYRL